LLIWVSFLQQPHVWLGKIAGHHSVAIGLKTRAGEPAGISLAASNPGNAAYF
jgi:hypothetical protein